MGTDPGDVSTSEQTETISTSGSLELLHLDGEILVEELGQPY